MTTQTYVGVDVQCHIFNGYDVPLSEFLTGPDLQFEPPFDALLRLITEIVEVGVRTFAPCASEEYAKLCDPVSSQREKAAGIVFSIERAVENEIATDNNNFSEYMAHVANGNVAFLRLYRSQQREEMKTLGVRPDHLRKVFSSNTIELFRRAKRENGEVGNLRNRFDLFLEQHNLHPQ